MVFTTSSTSTLNRYEKNTALNQRHYYGGTPNTTDFTITNGTYSAPTPNVDQWEAKYWHEKEMWNHINLKLQEENTYLKDKVKALEKALEGFLGRKF